MVSFVKKIAGAIWREADNTTFLQRAIKKVNKIEEGEKIIAPKHPTDDRVSQEALKNLAIKEEIDSKDEKLIEHVGKLTINSSAVEYPPDKTGFVKEHRNHDFTRFQYGFYEPPIEKLEKGRFTFREALEYLRARVEAEGKFEPSKDVKNREEMQFVLENHPAVKRVAADDIENVWRYFRPFVRQADQRVVLRADVEEARKVIEGKKDIMEILPSPREMIRELIKAKMNAKNLEEERFLELEDKEKVELLEKIKRKRREEFEHLQKRLNELRKLHERSADEKEK